MGLFDGMGGLGAGMLGLGIAGDVMGGYSAYQQQQRQRNLYNQQLQIANQLRNPAAVLAGSQPYFQANMGALRSSLPQFMRSTVNPMLGTQGIDPSGGTGQLIMEQAIAPQIMNAQQQAQDRYIQALTGAQTGLYQSGQNVGQPQGGMGNMSQALKSLMYMQALRNRGITAPQVPQSSVSSAPLDDSGLEGLSQYTTGGPYPLRSDFLPLQDVG